MTVPQTGGIMTTHKCRIDGCTIHIPHSSTLKTLSYENRMRVFMFAATGERSWVQPDTFVLPAEFNRTDDSEEES